MVAVSIITPVLNGADLLEGCIECVASQGFESLEHLIVVARGSSGDTMRAAAELSGRYDHLRVLCQLRGGQSTALNLGLAAARGAAVGILNVDDRYLPGAIARGVAALGSGPVPGFVYGRCRVVDGNGALLSINFPEDPRLIAMIATHDFPCNPSAYFYHRALHDLVGGYSESDEHSMDKVFIFRVAARTALRRVDEEWGVFLLAPGTKTFEAMRSGDLRRRGRRFRLRQFRALGLADQLRCLGLYIRFKLAHRRRPRPA